MRFIFIIFITAASLFAKAALVDGISFFVNESPVTLFQLYKTEQQFGIKQDQAMEQLIRQRLEDQEIKRYGIELSDDELKTKITQLANSYGLTYVGFKSQLEHKGVNWDEYREDFKRKAELEALNQKLVREDVKMPTESDIKSYYEINKNRFTAPSIVDAIQYSSTDRKALQEKMSNPYSTSQDGVTVEPVSVDLGKYPPEFATLFAQTPAGSFTQIITASNNFVTFYIKDKKGARVLPLEQVKNAIVNDMLAGSEQRILDSHFEKLRAQATINVVRLP